MVAAVVVHPLLLVAPLLVAPLLLLRLVDPLLLFKSAVVLSRPPHFLLLPVLKVAAD